MKITQMLDREDFYTINRQTLDRYFCAKLDEKIKLYIYPMLNAIVPKVPSKRVINYLLCEYSLRGSVTKRFAAKAFVWVCMHSLGLLASQKCEVNTRENSNLLIYPCNKKYRIFDFGKNVVDVIPKFGFDNSSLKHEIEFRCRDNLPNFVPKMIRFDDNGYCEEIITGVSLARLSVQFDYFRDLAYKSLLQYGLTEQCSISASDYIDRLKEEIKNNYNPKFDINNIQRVIIKLQSYVDCNSSITLTFSHGDLQAGNIWVEDETNHVFIIDWESWGKRSIWYDYAVLYQRLRPGKIDNYLSIKVNPSERAVVLLEDIIFHMREINSLPNSFCVAQFHQYIDTISQWAERGDYIEKE